MLDESFCIVYKINTGMCYKCYDLQRYGSDAFDR